MTRTIVVTVGGHTLTNDILKIEVPTQSQSVGLCTLLVLNENNEWGGDFEPKDAISVTVDGAVVFLGYVDNVVPYNFPTLASEQISKITGRSYAFDLAALYISKTYTQDEIDDIADDALSTASAEVTYTSGTTGPKTNYKFTRTYLLTGFRELCRRHNYDFYVAQDKALHFFAVEDGGEYLDGGGGRADVDLDLVAGSTSNNILKIEETERLSADIANYVEVSSGSLRDHWSEGNSNPSAIFTGAYTSCAVHSGNKTFTADAGTPYSIFSAGDLIVVSNAEDVTNNGNYTIATATDTVITVSEAVAATNAADTAVVISPKGHWIPENEDCQVGGETTISLRGNSVKITTTAATQEIGAFIDLATAGYGGTTVDLSKKGEGYYLVYYTSTDSNISIRPYLMDADDERIEFYRVASGDSRKGITEAITDSKWRRCYFHYGTGQSIAANEAAAISGQWFYESGSSFDWANVEKIGFVTKAAQNADTAIYIDDLTVPAIEVFRIEEDATSQSNYGKRMIHRSRRDLISQLEVNATAVGLLASRKDIMQAMSLVVEGNTSILYTGQSLDVYSPPYGINSDTKYRIVRLKHTIVAKREDAVIKGWDYTTTLELVRDNVRSNYNRLLGLSFPETHTKDKVGDLASGYDYNVSDDPSQWMDEEGTAATPEGTAFPTDPAPFTGQYFYLTAATGNFVEGLYRYDGSNWKPVYVSNYDTEANKPAFGTAGRIYFASDTEIWWYDTGAAWVELTRAEAVSRLNSLSEKAHTNLTTVTSNLHHNLSHNSRHVTSGPGADALDTGSASGSHTHGLYGVSGGLVRTITASTWYCATTSGGAVTQPFLAATIIGSYPSGFAVNSDTSVADSGNHTHPVTTSPSTDLRTPVNGGKIDILEDEMVEDSNGMIRIPVIFRGLGEPIREEHSFTVDSSDERIIKQLKDVWHNKWENNKRKAERGGKKRTLDFPKKMDWDEDAEKLYMDTKLMEEEQSGDSWRRAEESYKHINALFGDET